MTVDTLNNILMFIAIGLAIFGFYYYYYYYINILNILILIINNINKK